MRYNLHLSFSEQTVYIPFIPERASREWLLEKVDEYKRLAEEANDSPQFRRFYETKVDLLRNALENRYHVRLKNRASRQN